MITFLIFFSDTLKCFNGRENTTDKFKLSEKADAGVRKNSWWDSEAFVFSSKDT